MIDIYEIYTNIRTFWFSFGLMDKASRNVIVTCESIDTEFTDNTLKTCAAKLLYEEAEERLSSYFQDCIISHNHFSY